MEFNQTASLPCSLLLSLSDDVSVVLRDMPCLSVLPAPLFVTIRFSAQFVPQMSCPRFTAVLGKNFYSSINRVSLYRIIPPRNSVYCAMVVAVSEGM